MQNKTKNREPVPNTKTIKVIVYVEGGMVQSVRADSPFIEVDIWDQDNIDEEPLCRPMSLPDDIVEWEDALPLYPFDIY